MRLRAHGLPMVLMQVHVVQPMDTGIWSRTVRKFSKCVNLF